MRRRKKTSSFVQQSSGNQRTRRRATSYRKPIARYEDFEDYEDFSFHNFIAFSTINSFILLIRFVLFGKADEDDQWCLFRSFVESPKNEQFHPFYLIRFILIPHPQKKYWISFTVWIVDVLSLRSPLDHLSSFHHWDLGGAFKRSRRQACQYRVHKPYRNQYGHMMTMKKMMIQC